MNSEIVEEETAGGRERERESSVGVMETWTNHQLCAVTYELSHYRDRGPCSL